MRAIFIFLVLVLIAGIFLIYLRYGGPSLTGPGFAAYKHPQGLFSCEYPKGWDVPPPRYPGSSQALFLHPPIKGKKESHALASFWVHFYEKNEPPFRDSQSYMLTKTMGLAEEEKSPIQERTVGGRKVKTFWVNEFLVKSPEMSPREEKVKKEYVIIEADSGFFVLGFSLPLGERAWEKNLPRLQSQFKHFVKSFQSPL